MFVTLFVFTLVTAHVTAKLPSYIHPCGLKDPNYDQCIMNNIYYMKDKICTGIPELNIAPIEPLVIDQLVVFDTVDLKLHLKDAKIYGLCDFTLNFVHADPDKLYFDLSVNIKHLRMNATYDFNVHVLTEIAHKGIVHITSDNVDVKLWIDINTVTKNGKTIGYISKVNMNLNVKAFNYNFDEKEKELITLHKILGDIISNHEEEILRKIKPALEKEISKQFISIFNKVFFDYYEELFPERI